MIKRAKRAPGELGDLDGWEQFEAENEDEALRRRDFLLRTAAAAGLTGLAAALPTEVLTSQAAARAARKAPLPSPRDLPIDTFVVLMMENRSFDHYLGWLPGADGRQAGLSYPDITGKPIATHHLTPDFQGCNFRDPDHGWNGGRHQLNGGKLDGFVTGNKEGTGSDEFAVGYYEQQDLGFLGGAIEHGTVYDRFFCSILASTYPNRHYMWSAQGGGIKTNELPFDTLGHQWETIFDRAVSKDVSVGYFNSDIPVSLLYGFRGIPWTQPVASYYARAATGTLPAISFVDPGFLGESDGYSSDDHPHADIRVGQAFISDVVRAFVESPQWRRGALFLVYDEWGGFFDHVAPPRVPDDRASRDTNEDWGQLGFRIPAMCFSPYAGRGTISHATLGFESILKLISYRLGLGHLNRRHRYAFNIGRTLDFAKPNLERPELPGVKHIVRRPCARSGAAARAKPHDLVELQTSGYLERLGFEARPATFDRIFRAPDSVRRGLLESTR